MTNALDDVLKSDGIWLAVSRLGISFFEVAGIEVYQLKLDTFERDGPPLDPGGWNRNARFQFYGPLARK